MIERIYKIINPCMCETYKGEKDAFAKIEYAGGRLSICGVIGPYGHDCYGSAGQCVEEIRKGTPKEPFATEMLERFCNIWEEWHLNDMKPYCKHQKELGWKELSKKKVNVFKFILDDEARKRKKDAENKALDALRNGVTFTPTYIEKCNSNLKDFIDIYSYDDEVDVPFGYKPLAKSVSPNKETKTLGWVYPKDFADGILTKECPVCGYKYGTSWLKEEVPYHVLTWLDSLPDTQIQPAWI